MALDVRAFSLERGGKTSGSVSGAVSRVENEGESVMSCQTSVLSAARFSVLFGILD